MNYKKLLELYENLDNNNKEEFMLLLSRGMYEEEMKCERLGYGKDSLVNWIYNLVNYCLDGGDV